jgi:2-iminobutanoate/2-iminopropanoate deaminase
MITQRRTFSLSAVVAAMSLASLATVLLVGIVVRSQGRADRKYVNLLEGGNSLPYSDAVFAGNILYISSRIGTTDPKTGKKPDNAEQEAQIVLNSIKAVVEKAGLTMDDVVYVQIFCPDPATYFGMFNDVYKTYFRSQPPARAFTGSGPLVGGARFQVQAVAMKR